jgi:hypothetical protein
VTEPRAVRRCPVCEHPSVLGINAAILNGKSYRAISRDFRIGSERSGKFTPDHKKVMRHAEGCMETSYQQVQKAKLEGQGEAIHARMKELEEHVNTVLADALEGRIVMVGDAPMLNEDGSPLRERTTSDLRVIIAAVREARHNQALVAKLAGALPEGDEGEMDDLRKLLEMPEARALVAKLEGMLAAKADAEGANKIEH